jgi:plasmid maintenance system antidote protein VapI
MKKNDTQIGEIILQKLKEKDRNVAWLAREIGCNDSNLWKTLKNSQYIHFDLVLRISKALEEDFFAYGSQKLKET